MVYKKEVSFVRRSSLHVFVYVGLKSAINSDTCLGNAYKLDTSFLYTIFSAIIASLNKGFVPMDFGQIIYKAFFNQ